MLDDLLLGVHFEVLGKLVLNLEVGLVGLVPIPYCHKIFMVLFVPAQKLTQLTHLLLHSLHFLLLHFHFLLNYCHSFFRLVCSLCFGIGHSFVFQ